MPLYDLRCPACEGIFEKLLSVSAREAPLPCPYCATQVHAEAMLTGRNLTLNVKQRWTPGNRAEQLTGAAAAGPGTRAGAGRSSVLHVCKGGNCSLCG